MSVSQIGQDPFRIGRDGENGEILEAQRNTEAYLRSTGPFERLFFFSEYPCHRDQFCSFSWPNDAWNSREKSFFMRLNAWNRPLVLRSDREFCERTRAIRAVCCSIRQRVFLATARAPFLPIASAPHEEHLHVERYSAPLLQGARAAIPVTFFSVIVDTTAQSPLCHLTRFFRAPFLPLHPTVPYFLFIIPSPAPHRPPHGYLASKMVARRGSSTPATS